MGGCTPGCLVTIALLMVNQNFLWYKWNGFLLTCFFYFGFQNSKKHVKSRFSCTREIFVSPSVPPKSQVHGALSNGDAFRSSYPTFTIFYCKGVQVFFGIGRNGEFLSNQQRFRNAYQLVIFLVQKFLWEKKILFCSKSSLPFYESLER